MRAQRRNRLDGDAGTRDLLTMHKSEGPGPPPGELASAMSVTRRSWGPAAVDCRHIQKAWLLLIVCLYPKTPRGSEGTPGPE